MPKNRPNTKPATMSAHVPRTPKVVDRNAHAHDVPVVRSQSPARTPDSLDSGGSAIPKGPTPRITGYTQAGSVPLVEQDSPHRTPSGRDVDGMVADVPAFNRSPVEQSFDELGKTVASAVADSFATGARIDASAVAAAHQRAMKGGRK